MGIELPLFYEKELSYLIETRQIRTELLLSSGFFIPPKYRGSIPFSQNRSSHTEFEKPQNLVPFICLLKRKLKRDTLI